MVEERVDFSGVTNRIWGGSGVLGTISEISGVHAPSVSANGITQLLQATLQSLQQLGAPMGGGSGSKVMEAQHGFEFVRLVIVRWGRPLARDWDTLMEGTFLGTFQLIHCQGLQFVE